MGLVLVLLAALCGCSTARFAQQSDIPIAEVRMRVSRQSLILDDDPTSGRHAEGDTLVIPYAKGTHRFHPNVLELAEANAIQFCVDESPAICGQTNPASTECASQSPECMCYNWRFADVSDPTIVLAWPETVRDGCVVWTLTGKPGTVDFYWDLVGTYGIVSEGIMGLEGADESDTDLVNAVCPPEITVEGDEGCRIRHRVVIEYVALSESVIDRLVNGVPGRNEATELLITLVMIVAIGGLFYLQWHGTVKMAEQ